jgi:nicotinate-nucleotide--dimethylbenzimidazole phosphoribosyltransferase
VTGPPTEPDGDPEAALAALAAAVPPADPQAATAARERHDELCKPPGSLGRLEELGVRLAASAGRCPAPVPERPVLVVAAGDHGVVARGASLWPSAVTAAMVGALCDGRAAANALAETVGAEVVVLDAGVAEPLAPHPRLRSAGVRAGTGDLTAGPAMTRSEACRAAVAGAALAAELAANGHDLLVLGDMGIGNTTAAACLVAAMTGAAPEAVAGPGAGGDAAHLRRKAGLIGAALGRHRPDPADPLEVLARLGGLEHAALVGIALGAATARAPVLLDGVSTVAVALVAVAYAPALAGHLVASHLSSEPAARIGLGHLGQRPLLDLGMRLGEGTGGLLAVPLVRGAAAALARMGTLAEVAGGG